MRIKLINYINYINIIIIPLCYNINVIQKHISINTDYINLSQFLKLSGLISNGGHAKRFLLEKDVYVNDVKENRRGKKLYPNTIIKINNEVYEIVKGDK